jgi:colicin import membrane protein
MPRSADRTTRPPQPDPFRYGWRFVKKLLPDGTADLIQVPLTLADILHPQEGDVIPERTFHERDAEYLRPIFRLRAARLPGGYFLADCLIHWGVPGIRNHSPDLVAFRGVSQPPVESIGTFRMRAYGGRCVLAVEIVSLDTRENDVVHKFREYHQVRVPLYVLIDQEGEAGPRRVVAYRYTAARYVRLRPDRQGRVLLKPLGLWLGMEDQLAVCYDAETGERLGDYGQVEQARRTAERLASEQGEARRAAEQRVRDLEAELRRLRGERAP